MRTTLSDTKHRVAFDKREAAETFERVAEAELVDVTASLLSKVAKSSLKSPRPGMSVADRTAAAAEAAEAAACSLPDKKREHTHNVWPWWQPGFARLRGAIGCPWQACQAVFNRSYPALEAALGPRPRGALNTSADAWVTATGGLRDLGGHGRRRRGVQASEGASAGDGGGGPAPCPVCPTPEQHTEGVSMDNVLVILILGGRFARHEFENILQSWGQHVKHGIVLTNTPATLGSMPGPAWESMAAPANSIGCRPLWIMLLAVAEARMRTNPRIRWLMRSDSDTWWNTRAMLNQLNTLPQRMGGAEPTIIGQQFGTHSRGASKEHHSHFRPLHPVDDNNFDPSGLRRMQPGTAYATGGAGVLYNARAVCVMAQTLAAGLCTTLACKKGGMHMMEDVFMGFCMHEALQPVNVLHSPLMYHWPPHVLHVRAKAASERAPGSSAAAAHHHVVVLGQRLVRNISDYVARGRGHNHHHTPTRLVTADGTGVLEPTWLGVAHTPGRDSVGNISIPMRYVVSMHRTGEHQGRIIAKPKHGCKAAPCFASPACMLAWSTAVQGATCGDRITKQLDASASEASVQAATHSVAVVQFPRQCGACALRLA